MLASSSTNYSSLQLSYQKYAKGVGSSSSMAPSRRWTSNYAGSGGGIFRMREKYLILLGAFVLVCICYSAFVFLPDAGELNVRKALMDAWEADPRDLVVPPPRFPRLDSSKNSADYNNNQRRHDDLDGIDSDPHFEEDKRRLLDKINREQIPRPVLENDSRLRAAKPESGIRLSFGGGGGVDGLANVDGETSTAISDSTGQEDVNVQRRATIKNMMIRAWDGYAKYAWGANELRPITKVGHSGSVFGASPIGATIIDGMDTLYIMGLMDRYEKARKWVELSLNFNELRGDLSVFETNIRYIGGLLTCYALTKDQLYVRKATDIADRLLPAFDTPTGIPYALVNMRSRAGKNWGWASGGASILSEFGTLHLEFEYLSILTGKSVYKDKVMRIRQVLAELEKPGGLYPNYLNPKTGRWGSRHTSLGALGDSFYEYLLKSWLVTNKRDVQAKQMYDESMDAVVQQLIRRSQNGLLYIAEYRGSRLDPKMDHLACFAGGMFALHSANEPNATRSARFLEFAKEIGHTCHESYIRADTHLGPESFRFTNDFEAKTVNDRDKYYILRPEVIETYFYLWRITKDEKYREWAWDAAQAIENYCKTENGYSGIRNVYMRFNPVKDDVQQSFFLAETLKYLYLIFSDDDVLPLDKWVFNTEAHPLPIRVDDHDHRPPLPTSDQRLSAAANANL